VPEKISKEIPVINMRLIMLKATALALFIVGVVLLVVWWIMQNM